MKEQTTRDLQTVINAQSRKLGLKQKVIAEKLGITEAELSKQLRGHKPMSDHIAIGLSQILQLPPEELLLLAAVSRCALTGKNKHPEQNEKAKQAYQKLLDLVPDSLTCVKVRNKDFISLENFPDIVEGPWTVISGDRRERPVKSLGDMIGLSVATTDFMYLLKLPLPPDTKIRSDKTLLVADETNLHRMLNTNLLFIGSPAVSMGTRDVLRKLGATFMFNISSHEYGREQELYDEVGRNATAEKLEDFLMRDDIQERLYDLLAGFRKNGFVDPVDFKGIRGRSIPRDKDYGVIALTGNPWSKEHVACFCAGVHGGGTAGAVQMLCSPDNFKDRPWGGVIMVDVSDFIPWERRFENLKPRWETHIYEPARYLEEILKLIECLKEWNACRGISQYKGEIAANDLEDVKTDVDILEGVYSFASDFLSKKNAHNKVNSGQ